MDPATFNPDSPSPSPRSNTPPAHFSPPRHQPWAGEFDNDQEPGEHCAICLSPILKQATVSPCLHSQFCFQCILAWSDQSRKCPLCLGAIEHLRLDVRSATDFTTHHLLPLEHVSSGSNTPQSYNLLGPASGTSITSTLPSENFSVPTSTRPSRPPAPPRHALYGRDGLRASGAGAGTSAQALDEPTQLERAAERALERRRYIYKQGLFAKHVATNRYTGFKSVGPEDFARNAELRKRVTMFARRELQVFPSVDISFLVQYLLSIAAQLDLRSSAAIRLLSDFISPPDEAVHFAHEVEMFARSPFKSLEGYDSYAQYGRPEKEHEPGGGTVQVRLVEEPRSGARERHLSGGGKGPVPAGPERRLSDARYDDRPRGPPLPRGGKRRQPEPDWRERDSFVAPPPQSARRRRRSERDGDRYAPRPERGGRRRSNHFDDGRRDNEYYDDRRRSYYDDRERSRSRERAHSPEGGRSGYADRGRSRSRSRSYSPDKSRDLPPHQQHSPAQERDDYDRTRSRSVTPVAPRSSGSPATAQQPLSASASHPPRPVLSIFGRATQSIRPQSQPQLTHDAVAASADASLAPAPSTSAPAVPSAAATAASTSTPATDKRALLQARLLAEYRTSLSTVRTAPAAPVAPAASTSLRDRLRMRLELEKLEQTRAALVRAKAARVDWERANGITPGSAAAEPPAVVASPTLASDWADWSNGGIDWAAVAAGGAKKVEYTQDLKDMLLARLEEEKRLAGVTTEAPAFVEELRDEGLTKEEKLKAALKRRLAKAKEMKEGAREVLEARLRKEKEEEMARRAGELRERLVAKRRAREADQEEAKGAVAEVAA